MNKIFHNFLIYPDKQRQSIKFSSASYFRGLIVNFLVTFTKFEVNFFYWGAIQFFKISLGVHSPYPTVVAQDWEYHCVKNLGCSIRIKFVKNCPLPNSRKRVKGLFF